jgi:hypothetical protein
MDATESGTEPEQASALLCLPHELVCAIFSFVSCSNSEPAACARDLAAWCLTCSTFSSMCDVEARCRCLCLAAQPVLFGLALSPLFSTPEARTAEMQKKCWWRLRARLLVALPHRINGQCEVPRTHLRGGPRLLRQTEEENSVPPGHVRFFRSDSRRLSTHPFVCTSPETLSEAFNNVSQHFIPPEDREAMEAGFLESIVCRGVDYFEVTVVRDEQGLVSPSAAGFAASNSCLFVGLRKIIDTHSTVSSTKVPPLMLPCVWWLRYAWLSARCSQFWPCNAREIVNGEVVGCGIDWDSKEVFFVRNPTPEEPNTTDLALFRSPLSDREHFPALGMTHCYVF